MFVCFAFHSVLFLASYRSIPVHVPVLPGPAFSTTKTTAVLMPYTARPEVSAVFAFYVFLTKNK
jgi:hypothetical protein